MINKDIKKIFIACDTTNTKKIKEIIYFTKTKKINIGYKFGLEFFYSKSGRGFLSKIDKKNLIFLDLKLNDIPNTCALAIYSLKDIDNIGYITVHVSGGLEMLKKVKDSAKKVNKKIKILGVTVLTSFSEKSLKKTGHTRSIKNLVVQQAKLAKLAGLDGIVCSAREVHFIKKICKGMEIVTPGIRLPGDSADDQKRITTPKKAFKNGATSLVIGRSMTKGSIKKNFKRLIESLK
jgi:orotidine-5'-phosphate decarboxylase|tara:strand:+ start:186 stop:890 length:705 start_codon:yes stop_codon:yes gene_type:complete